MKNFDDIFLKYMNDQLVNIADYLDSSKNKEKNLKIIKKIWKTAERICCLCMQEVEKENATIKSDIIYVRENERFNPY